MTSAASVKDRLKNQAAASGKTMQETLTAYGLERTLNNGFIQDILALWISSWLRGYTIALFYQLTIAGPAARWILKRIREKG